MWAPWTTHVYKHDVERFISICIRSLGRQADFRNDKAAVERGIRRLEEFFADRYSRYPDEQTPGTATSLKKWPRRRLKDRPLGQFVQLWNDVEDLRTGRNEPVLSVSQLKNLVFVPEQGSCSSLLVKGRLDRGWK